MFVTCIYLYLDVYFWYHGKEGVPACLGRWMHYDTLLLSQALFFCHGGSTHMNYAVSRSKNFETSFFPQITSHKTFVTSHWHHIRKREPVLFPAPQAKHVLDVQACMMWTYVAAKRLQWYVVFNVELLYKSTKSPKQKLWCWHWRVFVLYKKKHTEYIFLCASTHDLCNLSGQ